MNRNSKNVTEIESQEVDDSQKNDESPTPSNDRESGESDGTNDSGVGSDGEADTTTIDKGPYGSVAILTVDEGFLRSLGFNPENVDELRYQPYNGAVLVEPVTQ